MEPVAAEDWASEVADAEADPEADSEADPEVAFEDTDLVVDADDELFDEAAGQVKSKRGLVAREMPTTPNCG